jgi:hypothetical protein
MALTPLLQPFFDSSGRTARGARTSSNFLFAAGQQLGEKRINGLVRVLLNEPAQPVHRISAELLRGTQLRADLLSEPQPHVDREGTYPVTLAIPSMTTRLL